MIEDPLAVRHREIIEERARVSAIDAEAAQASIAAQQAMTAKYNEMGLSKGDWSEYGPHKLRGLMRGHG